MLHTVELLDAGKQRIGKHTVESCGALLYCIMRKFNWRV